MASLDIEQMNKCMRKKEIIKTLRSLDRQFAKKRGGCDLMVNLSQPQDSKEGLYTAESLPLRSQPGSSLPASRTRAQKEWPVLSLLFYLLACIVQISLFDFPTFTLPVPVALANRPG